MDTINKDFDVILQAIEENKLDQAKVLMSSIEDKLQEYLVSKNFLSSEPSEDNEDIDHLTGEENEMIDIEKETISKSKKSVSFKN